MVVKRKLFLLLLITSFKSINAQVPDVMVKWGSPQKKELNQILGVSNNNIYALQTNARGDYDILIYNEDNFNLNDQISFKYFKYRGDNAFPQMCLLLNGKVNVLYSAYDKPAQKRYLLLQQMGDDGQKSDIKEIGAVNSYDAVYGNFHEKLSADSSKILVYSNLGVGEKENEQFTVTVFDHNFNSLWQRQVELPFTNKYFHIADRIVTNEGEVFILAYTEPDKTKGEKKEKDAPNRDYKLFRVTKKGDIVNYDLDLNDKYVYNAFLHDGFGDNDDQLIIGGFYSPPKDEDQASGSFLMTMDKKTMDINSSNTEPFNKDFFDDLIGEYTAPTLHKQKGKRVHFELKNIVPKPEGGAYVILEQDYMYVSVMTTTANGTSNTTTSKHYVSGDIFILNIYADGSIKWSNFIPKRQASVDDEGECLSYVMLTDGRELKFIYNDDEENTGKAAGDIKFVGNFRKAILRCATVKSDGSISYSQLLDNKDSKAIPMPEKSYQVDANHVVLYGLRGLFAKYYIGTMTLQ